MDIIKVISIGIIIGFMLVIYSVGYYFYRKDREERDFFNLD